MTGEEAQRWHVHAATCSPCTKEYVSFRREAARARRVRTLAIAAAAAIVVVIVGWTVLNTFANRSAGVGAVAWVEGWRSAQTDLRGHEALRGAENGPQLPPPMIPRGKLVWTIDLPVGSEPGHYDIELQQPEGENVARANGTASLLNGLSILKIRIDTRDARPGDASLRVRPPERSWSRYVVDIR